LNSLEEEDMNTGSIYFNEIDPFASTWLGNLARRGVFGEGRPVTIDARSIVDVEAADVRGYDRVHLFAGIGIWEYAFQLAGWPSWLPAWSGSPPCQPFSGAGRRKGTEDDRHLWPEYLRPIAAELPPVIVGEQVASPDGRAWLSAVRADLEALGYEVGAADLCAAGVGAPHIRQRLFFAGVRLGDADRQRFEEFGLHLRERGSYEAMPQAAGNGEGFGLGDAGRVCSAERESPFEGIEAWRIADSRFAPGAVRGFWGGIDWLLCSDPSGVSRWRPVRSQSFPLAHGAPARVGRLRAYGNGIVAPLAAEFLGALLEAIGGSHE
jgi:DNA (cytosine-5)-methyltransferase 1